MPKFSIRSYYQPTGRFRKITMEGDSKEDCCEKMRLEGYTDPFELNEVIECATDRQIKYLSSLGLKVPPGATKYDASEMIEFHHSGDVYPDDGLLKYAEQEGISTSKYIGEQVLYDTIFERLDISKRISFFIFSVHRDNHNGDNFNLNEHPHLHHFENFSIEYINDTTFIRSLKRYSGKELKFFGDYYHDTDNYQTIKGSTRSYAYKKAYEYLKQKQLVRLKEERNPNKKIESNTKYLGWQYQQAESSNLVGCFGLAILVSIVLFLLFLIYILFHILW